MTLQEVSKKLTLNLLKLSADHLCKQFGPRSGPKKCRACSGPKIFDTQMVLLKEFFEKVNFEKKSADDKRHAKLPGRQRVYKKLTFLD